MRFATRSARSLTSLGAALGATALLAGCTTLGIGYSPPETRLLSSYAAPMPGNSAVEPQTDWWSAFEDKLLNSLIEEGLSENLTVAQAIERVEAARATARVNGVTYQPSISGSGSIIQSGTATDGVVTSAVTKTASIDASWELDFFGAGRHNREAQLANVQAAEESVNAARLSLIGDIADAYVNIRTYQRRLSLARASLETQRATAEVVRKQVEAGTATELALSQAVGQQQSTAATIPSLEISLQQSINGMAILLGQEPAAVEGIFKKSGRIPRAGKQIGKSVPADLLRNRPDVRQSERELASAVADIGIKEADLYPSLTLSGALSTNGTTGSWSLGPTLTLPLFNRESLTANVDLAKSTARSEYLAYRETVLGAVQDVEDALVSYSKQKSRRAALAASVEAYSKAAELSKALYEAGNATYSELLSAQAAQQSAEDALAQSDSALASGYIALAKALGGGWSVGERP